MKFFLENRIRLLSVLWVVTACATSKNEPLTLNQNSPTNVSKILTLRELEDLEAKNPNDAQLKLKIALQYYCSGNRGQSLETLTWIKQFSTDKKLREEASALFDEFQIELQIDEFQTQEFQSPGPSAKRCSR